MEVFNVFVVLAADLSTFGFNASGFSFAELAKNTDGFAFGSKGWL